MTAVAPDAPLDPATVPLDRSLSEAVANCLRQLAGTLHRSLPASPDFPIRVPQQPVPPAEPLDPTRQLLDLAARHPRRPVTARLGRTGCRVHVPE
ncbi:hypothetical protein ACQEVC_05945 [Plantactinospora sp. CA-294935]|uniref:hypothetical protein n=1 Tax=Plantactinospora sp. CA-294935 TaxID=3240012 RepID=UPI003D8F0863